MFLSLATLAKYGFNTRKLTEADFFEICGGRRIAVQELDVVTSFYISILDHEIIVIDRKLSGIAREFAMYHELSHALLSSGHNGPQALFMGMCNTKEEHEADAFATMALIPLNKIEDESFADDSGIARKIYEKRLYLFKTYSLCMTLFALLL